MWWLNNSEWDYDIGCDVVSQRFSTNWIIISGRIMIATDIVVLVKFEAVIGYMVMNLIKIWNQMIVVNGIIR